MSCLFARLPGTAEKAFSLSGYWREKLADPPHSECEHIGFLVEFSPKQNDFVIVSNMEPKT